MDAVSEIRRALDGSVPLIGFSGSPWTLACYMVEGGSSDDYRKVKTLMYSRPDLMHHILSVTTNAVIAYLNAQIEAGAQAVMVFDSWGGVLAHDAYREFSLAYLRRIAAGLIREREGRAVPSIVFTKGGGLWLEDIADAGYDAVGLDWTVDIGKARELVGHKVALQGNLDPPSCSPAPTPSPRRPAACSTATASTPATSSTSATASRNTPRRTMSRCWSTRFAAIAAACARAERGRRRRSSAADARRPLWNSNFVLRQAKNCCTGLDLCIAPIHDERPAASAMKYAHRLKPLF